MRWLLFSCEDVDELLTFGIRGDWHFMDEETMSCAELERRCLETLAELQARIDGYDERMAMQAVDDDGKSTDQRAIDALERPERFHGEHDVAKAWLKSSKTARVWSRNGRH
jgi:hypothetical protein